MIAEMAARAALRHPMDDRESREVERMAADNVKLIKRAILEGDDRPIVVGTGTGRLYTDIQLAFKICKKLGVDWPVLSRQLDRNSPQVGGATPPNPKKFG